MANGIEYEAKLLAITPAELLPKLNAARARFDEDFLFRRYVFDTVPVEDGRWLRLRTNGQETTLTAKNVTSDTIDGTYEWEVTVDDFETTRQILRQAGLQPKGYQENHRFNFRLGDAILSLDIWPQLEPYLEIEAPDSASVEAIARQLGYEPGALSTKNTSQLYQDRGIELDTTPEIRLSDEQRQLIQSIQASLAGQTK